MKKFGILLLSLCVATPALADFWNNCTTLNGTIVTANSYGNDKGGLCNDPNNSNLTNNCNGKKFCISPIAPNWWSAFTWCESIGAKLASLVGVCPGVQQVNGVPCANLASVSNETLWTSTGLNTEHAFMFYKGTARSSYFGRASIGQSGYGAAKPLCEAK